MFFFFSLSLVFKLLLRSLFCKLGVLVRHRISLFGKDSVKPFQYCLEAYLVKEEAISLSDFLCMHVATKSYSLHGCQKMWFCKCYL